MKRIRRLCTTGLTLAISVSLAGCTTGGNFSFSNSPVGTGGGGSGGGGTGSGGGTGTGPHAAAQVYVIQESLTAGLASGSILQFAASSSGKSSPTQTMLAPTNTAFNALATDGAGAVYVAARSPLGADVRVYTAGATGMATPARVVPVNATSELGVVDALATAADGEFFVAEDDGSIASFSATAAGSVAPTRYVPGAANVTAGLSTLTAANGITADSAGNLYVLNAGGPNSMAVVIFGPTADGNVAPLRTITGPQTTMLFAIGEATDSLGNLYVTNNTFLSGNILVFAPGANGDVAPTRIIAGTATQIAFANGIKVDALGNIFVVSVDSAGQHPTVLKFAAGATGNVAPVASFTSDAWTVTDPGANIAIF